jgi:hypothetical protein
MTAAQLQDAEDHALAEKRFDVADRLHMARINTERGDELAAEAWLDSALSSDRRHRQSILECDPAGNIGEIINSEVSLVA